MAKKQPPVSPAITDQMTLSDGTYREFIENLPVMFYAVSPTAPHRPLYISPEFESFGYPLADWLTDPDIWDRVIHPDDRDSVLSQTRRAMSEGAGIDSEYRVVRENGDVVWVHDRSCFIRDKNGDPICWQGVIIDVTDRKHAQSQIEQREKLYRTLCRTIPRTSVLIFDRDFRYTLADGEQLKNHSWLANDFENKTLDEVFPPEIAAEWSNYYSRALDGEDIVIDTETEMGAFQTHVRPVRDDDGVIFAGMVMWRDVTESKRANDAIKESEARFRDLVENANDLIYTHDLDGNFTSLNRAGEAITGFTRDEALRMTIADVVAPEFIDVARTMTARKSEGVPNAYEIEIIAKDGNRVFLEINTRIIVRDGLPVGVQGIGRDITQRRQAEQSLHKALSLLTSTFESTADGIVVMGLDRRIITCNQKFIEMWDIDPEIIEGGDGERLIESIATRLSEPEDFRRQLDAIYADPKAVVTGILELKDGRIFERYSQPQYMKGEPVGRVACFRDITERNRAEEALLHYALHDTLTDLPNRVSFMNHLKQAVDRAAENTYSKFSVLFLDLDRFKVINDSLGHAVGDKLLIAIASRLKACVRPGDIVARLGGDEFTILLNRSGDVEEAVSVAERLQAKISEPFRIDNYEVFTTASIGIIVSGNAARQAEEYLRDADAAMYRAKETGKARYEVFDREMHVRNMNLLQVETDLRHAVERREFEVLYQPIVDIRTGSVREFEALIRWRHPIHGLVGPNEFVHVAEETGLIIPIGKWVIEESCRQMADWQRKFAAKLSVSVNLSAKQLMHPNLTSQVSTILVENDLAPSQLKLEVTESTVMEHSDRSQKVLTDLDRLGISLSTDDFGTGYSSLSYLQRFPFERLKIDRSFINLMDKDEKSGAIVKTILMLGENLGIEVVAEGIETVSQLEKLRALGCTIGQGFLFSRPIDRESAEDFLSNGANVFENNPALEFRNPSPMIEVSDVQ